MRISTKLLLYSLILFLSNPIVTQKSQFSKQRLKKIDAFFSKHIKENQLAGAVTLIAKDGKIEHLQTHGYLDLGESTPMLENAIVPIGSMTKIITSIAVLQLYEDGEFSLSDPIENYIPQFKKLSVFVHKDSTKTEPLKSKLTILDLLRHTAGIGYGGNSSTTNQLYSKAGFRTWDKSLKSFIDVVSTTPLQFQPGSDWIYGYSHDILGYLIEEITGMSLDAFCQKRIFEPLNLHSTGFIVPQNKANQLSTLYRNNNGQLEVDIDRVDSKYFRMAKAISGGGGWGDSYGGVVTTIEEFYIISQMLLDYGKYKGTRILGRKTVELMVSNQIGTMDAFGSAYGLGLGVVRSIEESNQPGSSGEVYWAGAPYNTYFWIDYQEKLIGVLFTNTAPFGLLDMMDKFKVLVLQALDN